MVLSLTFTQQTPTQYVATARVASCYALHIEQERFSPLKLQLKSVENGEYADCEDGLRMPSVTSPIYDKDFNHGVISEECPKWIRILSSTPVKKAFIIGESVDVE